MRGLLVILPAGLAAAGAPAWAQAPAPAPASASARAVNVYDWTDCIDPCVIAQFQRETGIAVRYDVYDSLETVEGKLLAGRSGYGPEAAVDPAIVPPARFFTISALPPEAGSARARLWSRFKSGR